MAELLDGGNNLSAHLGRIELRDKILEPASEATEDHDVPVREPPAWKLNYRAGRGPPELYFWRKSRSVECSPLGYGP